MRCNSINNEVHHLAKFPLHLSDVQEDNAQKSTFGITLQSDGTRPEHVRTTGILHMDRAIQSTTFCVRFPAAQYKSRMDAIKVDYKKLYGMFQFYHVCFIRLRDGLETI